MKNKDICPRCEIEDSRMPMVSCDLCEQWYHFGCVGVDESVKYRYWYCSECYVKQTNPCSTMNETGISRTTLKSVDQRNSFNNGLPTNNSENPKHFASTSNSHSSKSSKTATNSSKISKSSKSSTSSSKASSKQRAAASIKLQQIEEEYEAMKKLTKEYLEKKFKQQLIINENQSNCDGDDKEDISVIDEEQHVQSVNQWVHNSSNLMNKADDKKFFNNTQELLNKHEKSFNNFKYVPPNTIAETNWELSMPTRQQMMARKSFNVDLPRFDGCVDDWAIFISTYEITTKVCGFNNVENLLRLRKAICGEALETVRHRLNLPNCVPEIIEELRTSFGQPSMIIERQIEKIGKQPPPKAEDLESVIHFSNSVRDLCATMESSGNSAYVSDPTILKELSHKLPTTLKYDWLKFKYNYVTVDLTLFSNWLKSIADVLKNDRMTLKSDVQRRNFKSKGVVNVHSSSCDSKEPTSTEAIHNSNTYHQTLNTIKKCKVCAKETCISLKECKSFLELSVDKRWDVIKSNKLCRSCLKFHRGYACKNSKVCGKNNCEYKHHPLLHADQQSKNSTVISPVSRNNVQDSTVAEIHMHQIKEKKILFNVVPITIYGKDRQINTFALIDDGSSLTLVEKELMDQLQIDGVPEPLCLKWTADVSRTECDSKVVSFDLSAINNPNNKYAIHNASTVESLNLPTQNLSYESLANKYPYLKGLPITSYNSAKPQLLIGLDNAKLGLALRYREGGYDEPIAVKTRLGWSILGVSESSRKVAPILLHHSVQKCDCNKEDDLMQLMKEYFSLESLGIGIIKDVISDNDKRALDLMQKTTNKINDRYEIGLLWKFDSFKLPDSYPMALKRTICLQNQMKKKPALGENLQRQIKEYVQKDFVRKLSHKEKKESHSHVWYLPIFPVINEKKPGKVRLVFDAAAKVEDVSLNSFLLTGPDMLSPMNGILYRFRENHIAFCADIREMYPQIVIRAEDQHAQRFLWPNEEGKIDTYIMQRMTFGATCSPTCAQFVKNENAKLYEKLYPDATKAILENHYVDDYLDSKDNEENAIKLAKEVKHIHKQGGFDIRNWVSNSKKLVEELNETPVNECGKVVCNKSSGVEKILGMMWCTETDTFQYTLNYNSKNKDVLINGKRPTKREILRIMMAVFDPLGLLSHFLVYVKVLMQDIWRAQLDWDEPLTEELFQNWKKWVQHLQHINVVQIPRCYNLHKNDIQLHVMVDASDKACCAVAYFRTEVNGEVHMCLIGSKSRVAPVKLISIPRLELIAGILGVRLAKSIISQHSFQVSEVVFWSDSKTVLAWIKSDHRRYQQFVAFRISEILENTEPRQWRYVPTKINNADQGTKWSKIPDLEASAQWYKGPDFLYESKEKWPEDISKNCSTHEELRPHLLVHKSFKPRPKIVQLRPEEYSSWVKLRNIYAIVLRFINNIRKPEIDRRKGNISREDLQVAENFLFRMAQSQEFSNEINILDANTYCQNEKKQIIEKSSSLFKLTPFLDEHGVLRISGRINEAPGIKYETKNPVILPKEHPITFLIVNYYHERYLHQNMEIVVNEIRQKFYIPHLRTTLKKVVASCQKCKNQRAQPIPPIMAQLPLPRLKSFTRPFTDMGIDYFGPMMVKVGRRQEKRWVVLGTCLSTRAVHLEVAHTLSTDSCIIALRNIFSRRGVPNNIYSDNGTNFKGASRELLNAVSEIDKTRLSKEFTTTNTKWNFIPPASPHMGGSWERLVRSIKTTLSAIMGNNRTPDDETLRGMLIEAESIVNSRPLTYVPVDAENDEAITPNHFLLLSSNGMKPLGELSDSGPVLRKNYLCIQRFANIFWKRWIKEYLPELTRRTKWYQPCDPLKEDDIVVIVDENSPRNCWPKGRVIKVICSKDGQVRKATVQTISGIYERPAVKLAKLELDSLGTSTN